MREHNHGQYELVKTEKDILTMTTTIKQCVVHFFHKDFRRCQIIDGHLEVTQNLDFFLIIYLSCY
jgi:hypothetical protein